MKSLEEDILELSKVSEELDESIKKELEDLEELKKVGLELKIRRIALEEILGYRN